MRARQFQALLREGSAAAVPLAADFLRSVQSRAPTLDDPDTIRKLVEQIASEPDDAPLALGTPADAPRPSLPTGELTPDMILDVATPRGVPPKTIPLTPESLADITKPAKQPALVMADYRFDTRRAELAPITKPPETKPATPAAPRTTQSMAPLAPETARNDIGLLIVVGVFVLVLVAVMAIVVF